VAQGRNPAALALLLLAACAAPPEQPSGTSIPIAVSKPDGTGPFPAVVMLHDCSGLGPRSSGSPGRWTKLLLERGYVVLTPDSFSTRGFPDGVCTNASRAPLRVAPGQRVHDALEALEYAKTLPYVDARHVGVMGGSHGGSTTLATLGQAGGFAAGVALYPRCTVAGVSYTPSAPLLILAGALDDWTPADECRPLAQQKGVTLHIYPGAHHSFDSDRPVRYVAERVNPSSPSGRGATTGGNGQAWAAAIDEVSAFFARHLKSGGR
jgi:dienelactone hydrolase